jgi:signal transduction histidine kinase
MNSFEDSVLRILKGDKIVGAAFLVSDRLVATCAHVVKSAGAEIGGKISLRSSEGKDIEAIVDPAFWRDPNAEDISILRLNEPLENIQPAILGSSSGTKGNKFSTFGFPKQGQELSGSGEIIGQAIIGGIKVLQLRSPEVTPGFSGAPIFDETTKRVVGMVVAITPPDEYQRLGTTAFAIPSETLREICSELQISDICPYRSLDVFNEEDAPFFFGRQRVVQKMIDSLKREPRFLAVLGPSGSGKSSAVRAGLIPALKQGQVLGSERWGVITMRPAEQPYEQLDRAGLLTNQDGIAYAIRTWLDNHPDKERVILFIDPFEEVLVSTPGDMRQKFIKDLAYVLDAPVKASIIITLRDDFYSRFLQDAAMLTAWLERGLVNIPTTLERDELRAIVIEPATAVGLAFEEGLVEVILDDAAEADRTTEKARSTILPLLEFALTQLWKKQQDRRLTHNTYIMIDGVTGGLAQWADQSYHALNEDDRLLARRIFTYLIQLGDPAQDLPDSKRRRTISDLYRVADEQEHIHRVVRALADGRLLVTGRDDKGDTVELIHEALIREWGRIRDWMQSDRDFRIWQEQLSTSMKQWIANGKDEGALLRGAPLVEAEGWLEKRSSDVKDSEQEYINLSILLREREQGEQARRHAAEALAESSRVLSALMAAGEVPQQIISQLSQVVKSDRCAIFLADVNGNPRLIAHDGFPQAVPVEDLAYYVRDINVYDFIVRQSEPLVIGDVKNMQSWKQPDWLPEDRAWLGIPLYSKNKVMGMLTLSRGAPTSFDQDDVLLASTFAVQASIALENARLYDDLNRFSQMMERMIEQRVAELNRAYQTLEKLDKNKSDFINVAAHELRTPLVVIKGYMGMIKSVPAVQSNPTLVQAMDGVIQGTDRLHQIVNSMLDVARIDNQILTPHLEAVILGPLLRLIQKDYVEDLKGRELTFEIDPTVDSAPPLLADSELLQKAIDNVIVNAIKFTPDGGAIYVSAYTVTEDGHEFCEIRIRDTGIGIDPSNYTIIFEKLYQLGKVELHSSGRTKFKGGGPGLGLAIAAGIVKALNGKIWVESPGYDEEKLPGSTFFIQIPAAK